MTNNDEVIIAPRMIGVIGNAGSGEFDPSTMFSITNNGMGTLSLSVHGDDEPVATMELVNDTESSFRRAVFALIEIYIENSRA